jgi:chromosome segregation ATPase
MDEEQTKLITEITRGFAGIREQIAARDERVSQLSDKMIGVEFKIDQLKETLVKVEGEMSRAENERIKLRVDALEKCNETSQKKQEDNAKWIKGLAASVILLLLGFLLNFLRIGLK